MFSFLESCSLVINWCDKGNWRLSCLWSWHQARYKTQMCFLAFMRSNTSGHPSVYRGFYCVTRFSSVKKFSNVSTVIMRRILWEIATLFWQFAAVNVVYVLTFEYFFFHLLNDVPCVRSWAFQLGWNSSWCRRSTWFILLAKNIPAYLFLGLSSANAPCLI